MTDRRKRIDVLRKEFSEKARHKYGAIKERHTSFFYNWPIWSLTIAVIIGGAVLVNVIIWR